MIFGLAKIIEKRQPALIFLKTTLRKKRPKADRSTNQRKALSQKMGRVNIYQRISNPFRINEFVDDVVAFIAVGCVGCFFR